MSFLGQNWGSLLAAGAISAAVTWLITSVYFRKAQRERRPCFFAESRQLIGHSAILSPHVQVTHRGDAIPRVTLTQLFFWNEGKEVIRATDLAQEQPLKVRLPDDARIIHASVAWVTRPAIEFSVHATAFDRAPGEVGLRFAFLDRGDGALVEILHTGVAGRDAELTGIVIGVPGGPVRRPNPRSLITVPEGWQWRRELTPLLVAVVLLWVLYFTFLRACLGDTAGSERPWVIVGWAVNGLAALVVTLHFVFRNMRRLGCRLAYPVGGGVEVPAQVVCCSGVGEDEEFLDTDGLVKKAVVLARRPGWPPVPGAEYVWARRVPTLEEARDGCEVTLLRTMELAAGPKAATLTLRVDDEADVYLNDEEVAIGLKGYEEAHDRDVLSFLRPGVNQLRIVVRNARWPSETIKPGDNPTGVAYRLEATY